MEEGQGTVPGNSFWLANKAVMGFWCFITVWSRVYRIRSNLTPDPLRDLILEF